MHFAKRTDWLTGLNPWAEAVAEAKRRGRDLIDLTVSNPTQCGLGMAPEMVIAALASPQVLHYAPEPFGMPPARAAVRAYYREHGCEAEMEHICLTTSTSEAYSYLFRLLCDTGDEILIARPSYPLFDLLAAVQDVRLRSYPLLYEPGARDGQRGAWDIDFASLEQAIGPRTRALVLVHPNNPTGHYIHREERERVVGLCARHGLALIVDEVFLDYPLAGMLPAASFAGEQGCMCFVLSGLSKVCALPQMKLSWICASGPKQEVEESLRRLEIIADTFLSVGAPVQAALVPWLEQRTAVQKQVQQRTAANRAALDRRLAGSLGNRLALEGGWTAVVRVPRFVQKQEFAFAALDTGVMVQPGDFYDLPAGHCVISLLPELDQFAAGIERLPL